MKAMVLLKVKNNHPVFDQEAYPFHGWCLIGGEKASEWWQYAMSFDDDKQFDAFLLSPDVKLICKSEEKELDKAPEKKTTDALKTVLATADTAKAKNNRELVAEICKAHKITLDPFRDFGVGDPDDLLAEEMK